MSIVKLIQAGNALAFTAQITGGIAGRDYDLVAAIEAWAKVRDAALAAQADAQPDPVAGQVAEPVAWYSPSCGLPYGWSEKAPTDDAIYLYLAPQPAQPDVAKLWALKQKWIGELNPDPHTDAWTLGYLRAKKECRDELAATLTELGMKP